MEPRLSSYERTKDVVTQSEYYQEKSYNYGPYCSNREQRKDTQKGRSSFEKRLRSASSANSSLLSSNGKARRLLPELKDAVGEVKDSLGSSFGKFAKFNIWLQFFLLCLQKPYVIYYGLFYFFSTNFPSAVADKFVAAFGP